MTSLPTSLPLSASGQQPLAIASEAARRAGRVLMDRFAGDISVSFKGRGNVVTDVDLECESVILELLAQEYPDFGILSEESEPVYTGSPYTWVIDPLDGTRNYSEGIAHFSVVVALAHERRPVAGVTYDPVRDHLFQAELGKGATLNGAPISISSKQQLDHCLMGFDMGYVDQDAAKALDMVRSLWPGVEAIRIMGSGALGLAYAAAGQLDIYFHHRLFPWDVASGLLLVTEAGGTVVARNGQPGSLDSPSVIATSQHLLEQFLVATEGTNWRLG